MWKWHQRLENTAPSKRHQSSWMSNTKEWESACLSEDSVHCHFCQSSGAWSEVLGNSAKYFHFQLSLNTHNQIHSSEITDIISFSWRAKKNLNENWEMTQPQPTSSKFISLPQNHDLNWITVPQISVWVFTASFMTFAPLMLHLYHHTCNSIQFTLNNKSHKYQCKRC